MFQFIQVSTFYILDNFPYCNSKEELLPKEFSEEESIQGNPGAYTRTHRAVTNLEHDILL